MQVSKCQLSKKLLQLLIKYELAFDGTLGDWKTKPVSFQAKRRELLHQGQAFPVLKTHKIPSSEKLRGYVNWGYWSDSKRLSERRHHLIY